MFCLILWLFCCTFEGGKGKGGTFGELTQMSQKYCGFGIPDGYSYTWRGRRRGERGLCVKQQKKRKKICLFFAIWSVNSKCKNEAGEVW